MLQKSTAAAFHGFARSTIGIILVVLRPKLLQYLSSLGLVQRTACGLGSDLPLSFGFCLGLLCGDGVDIHASAAMS